MWGWLFLLAASAAVSIASGAGAGAARLVCYASGRGEGFSECTHLVYTGDARGDKLESLLKDYKKDHPRIKILLRIGEFDKDLRGLLKFKHIQGLEVHDAHKTLNRTKVSELVESARSAISAAGGGPLFLALPAHPELLAKYYDLQTLVKKADLMMLQTHNLRHAKNTTYHPSRLSGLWDMMNTDSVVDLAIGLGVSSSKMVISLPATALQFHLLNETLSTPGSPSTEEQPKEIDQAELCRQLQKGRWTLERDQDLSAPYAFQAKTWISFEDPSSIDVKGKYARVRGLAGLALHQADKDMETPCGPPLRTALAKVLNQQSRAPRAAVLRSLENEILSAPRHERALDALQVSPYRITQVVDADGVIHSIREDTRTEFSCSRQGYFVHPRSCARFYRCVKFDQYSPEFTVFEFDCPAGLAFDARHEVCVWPGSLPHSQACPGSSEIAPVPKARFQCPQHEGYYADPENCRWFFACLDHGEAESTLTAYEFRCPFGLGFDAGRLTCDWPWLVPACGNIARYEAEAFGFSSAGLTSAAGFHGQTADAINVAAHNSLVSGASLNNHVGIQTPLLSQEALDSNFIASQQLAGLNGDQGSYQLGQANTGFVHPTKYSSGSIILDDYRLPTKEESLRHNNFANHGQNLHLTGLNQGSQINVNQGISGVGLNQGFNPNLNKDYSGSYYNQNSQYNDDSGKYVHDPTGDRAEPYKHIDGPVVPYIHDDSKYKHTGDYYDVGRYSGNHDTSGYSGNHDTGRYSGNHDTGRYSGNHDTGRYSGNHDTSGYSGNHDTGGYSGNHDTGGYAGKYDTGSYSGSNDNGQYVHDNSGSYQEDLNNYKHDNSGLYKGDNSGQYVAGVYRSDGHIGNSNNLQNYQGSYSSGNAGNYLTGTKAYTGASHTLTAGAVNVGLVGKTTLIDAQYQDQGNYQQGYNGAQSYNQNIVHNTLQNGHVPIISQPSVSINHVGTDGNNLDGYIDNQGYVTTPTSSGIPTTATPFVTTAIPITTTYKTTYVPEAPKSTIKEIFGYSAQPVTVVHPTVIPVKQYTPHVQVTNYNSGVDVQSAFTKSEGYDYSKPAIAFEEGLTNTTPAPVVVSTLQPQGFRHSQQTLHQYSNRVPVTEEPFKKVVAYTTGPEVDVQYAQPTFAPQAFLQETVHNVQSNAYTPVNTVEYTTAQPTLSTPQGFSHQTLHKVDSSQVKTHDAGYRYEKPFSGYNYEKPAIAFEIPETVVSSTVRPLSYNAEVNHQTYHEVKLPEIQYSTPSPIVSSTYTPQSYSHQTYHQVEIQKPIQLSTPAPVIYQPVSVYKNPILKYTENVTPVSYTPQVFSQQTIHKVEANQVNLGSVGYQYETPKTVVQFENVKPTSYAPSQSYSQQTIHKIEGNQANLGSIGYHYERPNIQFEKPAQSSSQQTIHTFDANQVNFGATGYHYESPKILVEKVTPAPYVPSQSFSQQTIHKIEENVNHGSIETPKTVVQYEKPAQSFSQQTIHKVEDSSVNLGSSGYHYDAPKTIVQYENITPAPYVPSQSFSQQTIHKVEQNVNLGSSGYHYEAPKTVVQYEKPAETYSQQTVHKVEGNQVNHGTTGYHYEAPKTVIQYEKPSQSFSQETIHKVETNQGLGEYQSVGYESPKTVIQYTTPQPILEVRPQVFTQQTLHKVDASRVNYEQETGYNYEKPSVQFEHSTAAPKVTTYRPQNYNLQAIQSQEYLPAPVAKVELHQPAVTVYENPILKYTQNITPKPLAVTENYQPIVEHKVTHVQYPQYGSSQQNLEISQGYLYSQPEIQRDVETHKAYSDATLVSKQVYNLYNTAAKNEGIKNVEFVSTTPSNLVYEDHYTEYEQNKRYPEKQYQETYSASNVYAPVSKQNTYVQTQDQYDYKPVENNQYDTSSLQQISFSTSHEQPKQVESFHISSYPGKVITTKYNQESPEIQVGYNAEEYLPPVVSTQAPVTTTYKPRIYTTVSSTKEYSPPSPTPAYLPAVTQTQEVYTAQEYLPPSSTVRPRTKAPRVKSTTFKAPDYLPPLEETGYNAYQEETVSTVAPIERQRNIVVETSKSNLLGFGTVGPDAGLVSSISYTTSAPIVSSTYEPVSSTYVAEVSSRAPARRLRPKYKSTTQAHVESTTFKAPEYLPPSDEGLNFDSYRLNEQSNSYIGQASSTLPPKGNQNIVVETAKANLLGFGTIGNDAGLVSSTFAPEYEISSTYKPNQQEFVEVRQPARRTKPKVAVVTKINDFNPLLVRKLGAVCSCQSPVVILRGRRPNKGQENDNYDYEVVTRGDISAEDEKLAIETARLQLAKTRKQQVTSTFNPIIVPDDSYYQDYDESLDVTQKNIVSSTTPEYSSTDRIVRIRPRAKAVTVAPTYKSVLLENLQESPIVVDDIEAPIVIAERTGPRREELSAAIDCQRAGLFRHPRQCNKFYSCRWDTTKQKFTLHVFNCPIHLSFDSKLGACNWPSQGPACQGDTLLTNAL